MLDFEDYSLTQPAVLVTILTESVLKASIEKLLKNLKVYGYSISEIPGATKRVQYFGPAAKVQTEASNGTLEATEVAAEAQMENYAVTNLEVRAIVSPEVSNVILVALREQQREFAVLAYRQKVEALID